MPSSARSSEVGACSISSHHSHNTVRLCRRACVYTEPRSGHLGSTEREKLETRVQTLKKEAAYSCEKSVSVCRQYVESKLQRR